MRCSLTSAVLASVVLVALFAAPAHAQSASAAVTGVVHDQSGAMVPGAVVSLKNRATGIVRETVTDAIGRFHAASLEPGDYTLRIGSSGFKTIVRDRVRLTVGGTTAVDVTLEAGEATEDVTAKTDMPVLESVKSDLSRVVETVEIEGLPNLGRNFVDFVKLTSGVAPGRENVGGGAFKEPDTGVGPSATPRLSFGGQSELHTMVQVDGLDNVQTFTGLPRATPSQEVAKEFRVVNSTSLAEYGRGLGGFVNIVTKSGTNTLDGAAYYFGMNDALAKPSALTPPDKEQLSQHQYGFTMGGPVQRGSSFFLLNYEGQRRNESNQFSQVILNNLPLLNTVRQAFGLRAETTDQVRTSDYDQVFAKFDPRFGFNHTLSFKFQQLNASADNFPGGGGRASPASSAARDSDTRDRTFAVNFNSVISTTWANELRFQGADRHFGFKPLVSEPALEISNLIIMGKTTSDLDSYSERRFQVSDNITTFRGRHAIKLGADAQLLKDESQWNLFFPARIIFPNLQAFQSFTPVVFWWPSLKTDPTHDGFSTDWSSAVPPEWLPDTIFKMNHTSLGGFVQDQWQARDALTLSFGLRYDVEHYPSRYVTKVDLNNVQPRVGVSYKINARTLVRGGFGVFTDRIATSVGQVFTTGEWSTRGDLPNAQTLYPDVARISGRFYQNTVGGPAAPAAALTFLTTGQVPAATRTGLADSTAGDLTNPYSRQASAQISRELPGRMALTASYLYVHSYDLIGHSGNLNAVRSGTLPTGKPIYAGRQFPDVGDLFVIDNFLFSKYHGTTVELQRRFDGRVGFHASYTLGDGRNNGDSTSNLGDFSEDPSTTFDLEEARSRQHVRHRFTSSVMSQVPSRVPVVGGFRFSALVSLESGRRFTIYAGRDANGDGNPNSDRVGNEPRNSLEGPGFAAVNLRIGRDVRLASRARLELTADIFNLFNRVNVKDLNTNYGGIDLALPADPLLGYGTAREVFNPLQVQIGARVRF